MKIKIALFSALAACSWFSAGLSALDGRHEAAISPAADRKLSAQEPKSLEFSVKQIGPILEVNGSSTQVIGQGGNYAVTDGPGKMVWFLNNIWTGETPSAGQPALWGISEGGVALSASSSPYTLKGALNYVLDENRWPIPFLSPDFREYIQVRKFWPRAGFKIEEKYYVFYSILNNFGLGPYDYFRVGQGLAFSDSSSGPYKKAESGPLYFFWSDAEPAFGSAVLSDSDGWLYIYGRAMTEPGKYSAALARVKPENIMSREKYDYYSLDASSGMWTSDLTETTPVMENMPEEFSVSYNEYLKSYLALYLDIENREILLMRADYPWGPWKDPAKIMACSKKEYCSGAKEQPLFSLKGGKKIFFTLEKKNMPYIYELVFK